MSKRRIHQFAAGLVSALMVAAVDAATFSNVEVGNVTTTEFCICWATSGSGNPGVDVFSDAAGTQSLAGEVRVELYPLDTDRRRVETSVEIREAGRALREAMRAKNVVMVRVSGLEPGTEYAVRPVDLDETGTVLGSGDLQVVTTSQSTGFVGESRQVELDMSALEYAGTFVAGTIVTISTPEARYPLFAVVGDGWSPTRAYADLTRFLNAVGDRNLLPSGVMPLGITWKGLPATPGAFAGPDIDYDGSLLVAQVNRLAYDVTETDVDFVITFARISAVVGLPLQVGMEARDPGGVTLDDYDRAALVGSTGSLAVGAGNTAVFVDGLLASHVVVFDAPGQVELTVSDPLGGSMTSAPIEVLPLSYNTWRSYYFGDTIDPAGDPDANPDGDELSNKSEYTTLRNPLVVSPGLLNASREPGGLRVSLDFNRFQSEYRVRFQTSVDLRQWHDSAIGPGLQQTLPDRDVVAAFFPSTEFNDEPFGAVRAVFEMIPPVTITGVNFSGELLVVDFTGDPGVNDWRVMGSEDLVTFPYDRTADTTITENLPGQYHAEIDLAASFPNVYFIRIER